MVLDMVPFKGDGAGEELGKVGQDAGEPVGGASFEQQVVCTFMDHDEQGVVGEGAEEIGSADDHPPGAIFKQPCQDALKENEAEDGKDSILVLSDELSYF